MCTRQAECESSSEFVNYHIYESSPHGKKKGTVIVWVSCDTNSSSLDGFTASSCFRVKRYRASLFPSHTRVAMETSNLLPSHNTLHLFTKSHMRPPKLHRTLFTAVCLHVDFPWNHSMRKKIHLLMFNLEIGYLYLRSYILCQVIFNETPVLNSLNE